MLEAPEIMVESGTDSADTEFSPQDEQLIERLVCGDSYSVAANRGGVSVRTVKRRMATRGFRNEVRRRTRRKYEATSRKATAALANLVDYLSRVANDDGVHVRDRISAIRQLQNLAEKGLQLDLVNQLDDMTT